MVNAATKGVYHRVERYWSEVLGASPELLRTSGVHFIEDSKNRDSRFVYLFVNGPCGIVCAAQEKLAFAEATAVGIQANTLLLPGCFSTLFQQRIDRVVGPAVYGYAEESNFKPVMGTGIRALPDGNAPELRALRSACTEDEWDDCAIMDATSPIFALLAHGTLVSAAFYALANKYTVCLGIITHPEYRACGYGRAAASAAMTHAFALGHLLICQCRPDNTPFFSLARALGIRHFGTTVALHLET